MAFENLPEYPNHELEKKASQFLATQYGSVVRIPVDVEWLLDTLGVDLDCYPALRANYFIEGGVWRDTQTGRLTVFIDEAMMDDHSARGVTRYRTTVAEELAHLLIHREIIDQIDDPGAAAQSTAFLTAEPRFFLTRSAREGAPRTPGRFRGEWRASMQRIPEVTVRQGLNSLQPSRNECLFSPYARA
jgi:hypothetical protein